MQAEEIPTQIGSSHNYVQSQKQPIPSNASDNVKSEVAPVASETLVLQTITSPGDKLTKNFDHNGKFLIGPEITMDLESNIPASESNESQGASEIRVIFGPPRSGTSFLQRMLCQNSDTFGIYEPARTQLLYEQQSVPNYGPFFRSSSDPECHPIIKEKPHKTIILKEALGNALSDFEIDGFFPNVDSLKKSKPVFIFREPISTFESIKRKKWYDMKTFVGIYKKTYKSYLKIKSIHKKTTCLTYEKLVENPQKVLEQICQDWGLKYEGAMIPTDGWKTDYFQTVHYHHALRSDIENEGIHNSLLNTRGVSKDQNTNGQKLSVLSPQEKQILEIELTPIYTNVSKDSYPKFDEMEHSQPNI